VIVADRLDVAERFAEGRAAVEDTQRYVLACHLLGYEHPDLTSRPSQVREWYDSEDGLDLRALDGDCAQLRAVVSVVAEALRMQRAQVDALTAAWTGPGAESAIGFLQRHCAAASTVAAELRAAAQRCESLRDNLWHLVDVKVATAIAVDDRTLAHRSAWLAAADVVTTGAGDRPTAEELVRQQVAPYVDNDIRNDWLTAMRSAQAAVAASYDMVVDKFAVAAPAYFEVPDDLRPGHAPFQPVRSSPPTATAAPVAAPAPQHQPSDSLGPAMPAAPPGTGSGLGDAAALPAAAGASGGFDGLGGLGGLDGLGGLGGLGGLANRIVEAMGGLLGSGGRGNPFDPFDNEPFDEDRFGEDPFQSGDKADDKAGDKPGEVADDDKPDDVSIAGAPPVDGPRPAVVPRSAEAVPAVAPAPVAPAPVAPAPVAAPPDAGKTPCEIAGDELPQAGQ
jgi:hypothetical protein